MTDKFQKGCSIVFTPSARNTGAAIFKGNKKSITIKKNGIPVRAGDLKEGQTITINRMTGEIIE